MRGNSLRHRESGYPIWIVSTIVGLLLAAIEVGILLAYYRELGPLRSWRFLLFYGAGLATVWSSACALVGKLLDKLFSRRSAWSAPAGIALAAVSLAVMRQLVVVKLAARPMLSETNLTALALVGATAVAACVPALAIGRRKLWSPPWAPIALAALCAILFQTRPGEPTSSFASAEEPLHDDDLAARSSLPGRGTNILLITIDTLRADHLEAYGYQRATAPNMASLAARGVRFAHAVTQRTLTSPALATLLTGTHPPTHGLISNGIPLENFNLTMAEVLGQHGYRSAAVLSIPGLTVRHQFGQGFDEFQRTLDGKDRLMSDLWESRHLNDLALPALDRLAAENAPFLLWVHYRDPHAPYLLPEEYRSLFAGDDLYSANAGVEVPLGDGAPFGAMSSTLVADDRRELDFVIAQYDAEIRFNDESVGLLLERLARLGLSDETLIVVAGDHGEALGEDDYFFTHGYRADDFELRVPLLLAHPRLPAGRVVDGPVGLVDLLPTVLDLVGIPSPGTIQGESLLPRIRRSQQNTPGARASKQFFISGFERGYLAHGVTSSSHKLIIIQDSRWRFIDKPLEIAARLWLPASGFSEYRCRRSRRKLYDLARDPAEDRNLAGMRLDVEKQLADSLWQWMVDAYTEGERRRAES